MATPIMQVQNVTGVLRNQSPGSLRINTFNANGTVLDVHTGYTLATFGVAPSQSPNFDGTQPSLVADVTATFDATGLTISWTAAQATTMINALQAQLNSGVALLSNDGGTTTSQAAVVNLNIDQLSQLI